MEVVNAEGKPVVDAHVAVTFGYPNLISELRTNAEGRVDFLAPESERIEAVIAWKDGGGFDYEVYALGRNQQSDLQTEVPEFPSGGERLRLEGASPVTVKVVDAAGDPIEGVQLYPWLLRKPSANRELNLSYFFEAVGLRSDASGQATFGWMPVWQDAAVTIWPTAEGYARTRAVYEPAVDKGQLTVSLDRLVPIRGRVLDPQGEPVEGASVQAAGEGYGWDGGREQTTTSADGSYELRVPPEQIYMVTAASEDFVSDAIPGFAVHSGKPVEGIDLKLRKPTRLSGRLTAEPSGEPIAGERVYVYQYGDDLQSIPGAVIANPDNDRRYVRPMLVKTATTDEQGGFEFLLGDGSYDVRPPRQGTAEQFEVSGEDNLTMGVTMKVRTKTKLVGTVRRQDDDRPLAKVRLSAVSQNFQGDDWVAMTGEDGTFAVERLSEPTYVAAFNKDRSLGAVVVLAADEETLQIDLQRTGAAQGVLHQTDSSEPAAQTKISYGIRVPDEENRMFSKRFGGSVVTDSDGRFELTGLVPGWKYELSLESTPEGIIPGLGSVTVNPAERVELGTMRIPPPPKPYVPPTLDDRIARAMSVAGTVQERFERGLERSKRNKQKLLMVAGKPDDSRLRRFMELRYQDRDFSKVRDDFLIMAVSTSEAKTATELKKVLDDLEAEAAETPVSFSLVLVDPDGNLIAQDSDADLIQQEELSKEAVIAWLRSHMDERIDARELYAQTLAKAKQENKRVIVQETATWCGPCHMLSDYLSENQAWEADYIWIKMDHRYTGARELMAELRDGAKGGIPWYAILDAQGNKLVTSNHFKSGDNIGFPSSQQGREHFKHMLLETRQAMTDEQIDVLVAGLEKDE
ncbi:carboxypeptidase regulatory-like domain-containing protein [Roseimaritima sediminicola]|uniref:carboxypeptidase regulatory-like domain-containing protein n=1 Tax=Roseimaritima sediminicola TaxID=2662066 RepID=UPI001386D285|nr:carboxypeptidase regulatory-like domain-containing protein [Roseimaritima sediminicola]